LIDRINVTL